MEWEYKVVRIAIHNLNGLETELNGVGKLGWEFCFSIQANPGCRQREVVQLLIFKRPKAEQKPPVPVSEEAGIHEWPSTTDPEYGECYWTVVPQNELTGGAIPEIVKIVAAGDPHRIFYLRTGSTELYERAENQLFYGPIPFPPETPEEKQFNAELEAGIHK